MWRLRVRGKRGKRGFTLVETLLAVVIISVIGLGLYHVFSNGVRIWRYANVPKPEFEIHLVLERLETDIRNAILYRESSIKGRPESVEFYTLAAPLRSDTVRVPARIRYEFKQGVHAIERSAQLYEDLLNRSDKNIKKQPMLIGGVQKGSFQYFKKSSGLQATSWQNRWPEEGCLPDAIKASVEYQEKNQIKVFSKIIHIPSGGCSL